MFRLVLTTIIALALALSLSAQPAFDPAKRAAAVAPFVDAETIAVARIDLGRLRAEPIAAHIATMLKLTEAEAGKVRERVKRLQDAFAKTGAREVYLLVSFADLQSPFNFFVPLPDSGDARALFELLDSIIPAIPGGGKRTYAHKNGRFFAGSPKALLHFDQMKPDPRPELEKAFRAAGDTDVQLVFAPSNDHRRVVEEMLGELPKQFSFVNGKKLSAGVRWAAFGFNSQPKLSFQGVVQSQDAASAKAMRDLALDLLQLLGKVRDPNDVPLSESFGRDYEQLVRALTPEVVGDRLTFQAGEEKLLDILAKLYAMQRQAMRMSNRMNYLKQIGVALHNYHDTHGAFPPQAASGQPGAKPERRKPLLSWRVYILPYIEEAPLFMQFRLDEPWDSPHNRKLIAKMPRPFRSDSAALNAEGKTRLVAPLVKNGIFEPAGTGTKISEVTDGTSTTIMVLEAAPESAVVWTKPDDLPIDHKNPAKGVFAADEGSAPVLFADGSVRAIKKSIDAKSLLYLFLRNDGNVPQIP